MHKNNTLFKGKYFIAFYDKDGENFVTCFDSIINILYYLKKPITREEEKKMYRNIYYAIKNDRLVYFLNGQPLKIYLIEI